MTERFKTRIARADQADPARAAYIAGMLNGQRAALKRERIRRERDFWHRQATKAASQIAGDELSLGRVEKRGDRALIENSLRGLRRALTEASGRAGCDPDALLTAARYEVRRKASDSIGPKQAQARGIAATGRSETSAADLVSAADGGGVLDIPVGIPGMTDPDSPVQARVDGFNAVSGRKD